MKDLTPKQKAAIEKSSAEFRRKMEKLGLGVSIKCGRRSEERLPEKEEEEV